MKMKQLLLTLLVSTYVLSNTVHATEENSQKINTPLSIENEKPLESQKKEQKDTIIVLSAEDEKILSSIKKVHENIYDQLFQCMQITEELSMRVSTSHNQLKHIKNKKEVLGIISQLHDLIDQIRSGAGQYIEALSMILDKKAEIPQKHKKTIIAEFQGFISTTLPLCKAIAEYLNNAVNSSLKDLKPFDIEQYLKRNKSFGKKTFTPQETQSCLDTTTQSIQSIKNNIGSMGLTWYNKAIRTIDSRILSPLNYYNIPSITFLSASTVAIAALVVWKYGNDADNSDKATLVSRFIANSSKRLRDIFGKPIDRQSSPIIMSNTDSTINLGETLTNKEGGILPFVYDTMTQALGPCDPIMTLFGGALATRYASALVNNINPWITVKISKLWNTLGGWEGHSLAKGYWDYAPRFTFDNMIGLDSIKEELSSILFYLEDPEKMVDTGLEAEKGWLLTGKSRAGKSFSIECLCGEIEKRMPGKYKFWKLDAAAVKYFGIKTIFEMAKEEAPVILYIDEIHLLLENPTDDLTRTLLHEFLTTMQSTLEGNRDSAKPVILFTATNKEWLLPDAVRASGRLGKEIRIEFPNLEERKTFIVYELSKKALNPRNFDIDSLAQKTNEKSFEDIRAIIRHAMTKAHMRNVPLTHEMLEDSLNSEIRDIILDDHKNLPRHEKEILAAHFAGRALSLTLLKSKITVDTVTIKALKTDTKNNYNPQTQQSMTYGALVTKSLHDTIKMYSHGDIIAEIKSLLAGFVAEEQLLGSCSHKCHPASRAKAYDLTKELVFGGIDPHSLSKKLRDQKLDEAYALLEMYKQEVAELLHNNHKLLDILMNILIDKEILTDKDIEAIIAYVEKKEQENNASVVNENMQQVN